MGLQPASHCSEGPGSRSSSVPLIRVYSRSFAVSSPPLPLLNSREFPEIPGAMSKRLTDIVQDLVDSFQKVGGINHLDGSNLPSREAITEITRDLLRLMFPGFYDKQPIHSNQLQAYTSELVSSIELRLENELHKSLEYRPCDHCDRHDLAGTAARVGREFLHALPAVRAVLQTDVPAAYEGDPAA